MKTRDLRVLVPLAKVQVVSCNLVPTDKLMKPVIVLRCPLECETASRLQAHWLFDIDENPNHFEGTIKLPLEMPGADLTLNGAGRNLQLKTQKVSHFNCLIDPDPGEPILQLSFRAHLKPIDVQDADALQELMNTIKFLASLNKASFEADLVPQQGSLFESTVPGDGGPASPAGVHEIPFLAKVGRKGNLTGRISIKKTDTGWLAGWEIKGSSLTQPIALGVALKDAGTIFISEEAAKDWAAGEMMEVMRDYNPANPAEIRAIGIFCDQLLGVSPILKRDP